MSFRQAFPSAGVWVGTVIEYLEDGQKHRALPYKVRYADSSVSFVSEKCVHSCIASTIAGGGIPRCGAGKLIDGQLLTSEEEKECAKRVAFIVERLRKSSYCHAAGRRRPNLGTGCAAKVATARS
jgi:hypothetical protein